MGQRYLVIGCGFSGAVLANQLSATLDCSIDVWDERTHIGGNCHTKRDAATGIMVHEYGPHIFNTNSREIWDYVTSFGEFYPYVHRVKARYNDEMYSLPINLHTINQYFKKAFSPTEAKAFIDQLGDKSIDDPRNFEEQAHRFIGKDLYEAFFYGYTKKQWGCEPSQLPASILKRIPVRFTYDDNYHLSSFTGIPVDGYTALIEKMLLHPSIKIHLDKKFDASMRDLPYDHIFFTGPLDGYFGFNLGRLGYRTVSFEKHYATNDFQGTAQVNYCDLTESYTRITEHKYFAPWEKHEQTVYFTEYSKETGANDTPFYPKRLEADIELLKRYRVEAQKLNGISFLGRLATYRYMDMHHVIGEAMQFTKLFVEAHKNKRPLPLFSNDEI